MSGRANVDDARRDQAAEADAEVDQHEVDAEGALAVLGRDESTQHACYIGPQPAPPKQRDEQGRHASPVPWCGRGPKRPSRPASAVSANKMTRNGPNRSVIVPQNGRAPRPTTAARASSNVAKLVEKSRTLCR